MAEPVKNEYAIRISQPGLDVTKCADYEFVFNSDWPSLQIAFEDVVSISSGSSATVPHGLGFPPMTMVWKLINGVSVGRVFDIVTFDATNVYISDSVDSTVTYSIKCYNLDISEEADYELIQAPGRNYPYDPSYGIKVSKSGADIESDDLRDFILHSRCQSPALLTILNQESGVVGGSINTVTYTNPAGYTPWVLGFTSPIGDNSVYQCFAPGGNQAAPAFFQIGSTSTLWIYDDTNGLGSIVTLRDPLIVPEQIEVTY